ncbi:hypothetical protein ASD10_04490 [Aeromicrobium sp. Root472D3]|nr:hypothetical protein ASD10_04490 [Aeromicrobium sp. Root472D3]
MLMVFTPLHRELGLEPSDLTLDLLHAAVEHGVRELDDLDWKKALPVKERHEEFAKDVAAMANSGGGMLVFGVQERDDRTSAAGALVGVDAWNDNEERRLRQVAYSVLQPPVHGLSFRELTDGDVRAVALTVPASSDAPHLVWSRDKFTAPIRYGAQTEYMNERQLEDAYAARRQARTDLATRLQDAATNAVLPLATRPQVWLSLTAAPTTPRPSYLPRLTEREFSTMVSKALVWNPFVVVSPTGVGIEPRPRYRRWTTTDSFQGVSERAVEVHDDGTMVYAVALHQPPDAQELDVHPKALHEAPAAAVWLLRHVSAALNPSSNYVLRVNLHSDAWPVYFRTYERSRLARRHSPVVRFEPVELTIDPQITKQRLLDLVRTLVADIINQGGSEQPSNIYLHRTISD